MSKRFLLAGVVALMAFIGCSNSEHDGSSTDPHAVHSAGSSGAAGAAGAGAGGATGGSGAAGVGSAGAGGSGNASAALQAPQIDMVMPMQGALHVMWINKQADCDTIEGERKTDTDPYAMVFTVPGEADNKHDTSAMMDMTYTYRLRCKKGDAYSDYSNEKSLNPKQ
ncbi:MAG: hypothetical protein MUF64_02950 [Polyangiaceae bacterium]|nr:hypothetical protein [Polyangiaceae bacterium]